MFLPLPLTAKKFTNKIQQLYKGLYKLPKEMNKLSTYLTIITGDFNVKIGERNNSEDCIELGQEKEEKIMDHH